MLNNAISTELRFAQNDIIWYVPTLNKLVSIHLIISVNLSKYRVSLPGGIKLANL